MISPELLSEVLKDRIIKHDSYFKDIVNFKYDEDRFLNINYKGQGGLVRFYLINIYELTHLCKKWAYTKYQILLDSRVTTAGSCFLTSSPLSDDDYNKTFVDDTEYIAVFKACQWILDNKGNKND